MIVDSSALCAILKNESDAPVFAEAIGNCSEPLYISAATLLECAIVMDQHNDRVPGHKLDELVASKPIIVVPFSAAHAQIARRAYRDFGRGSGHGARLNMGDCFAYALAEERAEALLYKGADFGKTDVRSALP